MGTRKVLSRRKALQEFYKMKSQEGLHEGVLLKDSLDEPKDDANGAEVTVKAEEAVKVEASSLTEPEAMARFLRTASIREVLQVRNAASSRLNHHDLEKKSIIYDNYYDLIKLNQILSNVNAESRATDERPVTHKYMADTLAELSEFLEHDAATFNQAFPQVVDAICLDMSGSDSAASVRGIQ